jgi:hypothetical protein
MGDGGRPRPQQPESGDLNRILQTSGALLREHDEVPFEGSGNASEGFTPVSGPAPFFEAGDHGPDSSHPLRQCTLAETGTGAQVVDELTVGKILLYSGPRLVRRFTAILLHAFPSRVVGHFRLFSSMDADP